MSLAAANINLYPVVIAQYREKFVKYFQSFSNFAIYLTSLQASEIIAKYVERGKYLPILQETTWSNYFIVKYQLT